MISAFGKEEVAVFCKCNTFKYTFRSGIKQPKDSILKAEWYLKKYMELAPEFCEEWRQHSSGLYEVSSLGNIRRTGNDANRKKVTLKNGYDTIVLSINGETSIHYVHRLVAECFIPNPNNYSEINHKNHIRTDNRVENLEWCSRKYNVQDAIAVSLYVYNVFGEFIDKFNSIRECERFLNYGRSALDSYIDSGKPRGNLVFYTRRLSEEDIEKASWHLDAFVTLKDKLDAPVNVERYGGFRTGDLVDYQASEFVKPIRHIIKEIIIDRSNKIKMLFVDDKWAVFQSLDELIHRLKHTE
jgi:hypothetical protein